MKKFCKIMMIIMFAVAGLFLVGLIVCIIGSPEFGAWLLDRYENLTSDYGHTVVGMYRHGAGIAVDGLLIFGIIGLAMMFLMIFSEQILKLLRIYARSDEDPEDIKEEEKTDDPQKLSVADGARIVKKLEKKKEKEEKRRAKLEAKRKKIEEAEAKMNINKSKDKPVATENTTAEKPTTQQTTVTTEAAAPTVEVNTESIAKKPVVSVNPVDNFLNKFKK